VNYLNIQKNINTQRYPIRWEVKSVMSCCEGGNCPLQSVVTVDDRGQLVLPKDLRDKWDLKGGDKLAVVTTETAEGEVCCAHLVKADMLTKNFRIKLDISGPMENK